MRWLGPAAHPRLTRAVAIATSLCRFYRNETASQSFTGKQGVVDTLVQSDGVKSTLSGLQYCGNNARRSSLMTYRSSNNTPRGGANGAERMQSSLNRLTSGEVNALSDESGSDSDSTDDEEDIASALCFERRLAACYDEQRDALLRRLLFGSSTVPVYRSARWLTRAQNALPSATNRLSCPTTLRSVGWSKIQLTAKPRPASLLPKSRW